VKAKRDSVNGGSAKHPLMMVLTVGLFFFMLFILIILIYSDFSKPYFYSSMFLGIVGVVSFVWLQLRPGLYARFFAISCLSGLSLLIACLAFGNLFPNIASLGIMILTIVVLFFHALPIWSATSANFVRRELSGPKTKFGRVLYKLVMLSVPIVSIAGAILGRIFHGSNKISSVMFLLIFLPLAIIIPYGSPSPSSPWEHNDLKDN
jgi:hypothetical protein